MYYSDCNFHFSSVLSDIALPKHFPQSTYANMHNKEASNNRIHSSLISLLNLVYYIYIYKQINSIFRSSDLQLHASSCWAFECTWATNCGARGRGLGATGTRVETTVSVDGFGGKHHGKNMKKLKKHRINRNKRGVFKRIFEEQEGVLTISYQQPKETPFFPPTPFLRNTRAPCPCLLLTLVVAIYLLLLT